MKRRIDRPPADETDRATRDYRRGVLSTVQSPGWLAVAGAWSVALATPYLGPLFALPSEPGEWVEITFHVALGLSLLAGAVAADQLGAQRRTTGAEIIQRGRWLVLAAGVVLVSTHWFSMPALDGGHPTWTRLTAHLMPGLMALATAAGTALANRIHPRELLQRQPGDEHNLPSV